MIYELPPPVNHQDFERLLPDLLTAVHQTPFQPYGRSGQKQDGFDAFGKVGGKVYGAQCKKKKSGSRQSSAKKLIEELEAEFAQAQAFCQREGIELQVYLFATTTPADTKVEAHALKLSQASGVNVCFWNWNLISEKLQHYPDLMRKYYPEFKPGLPRFLSHTPRLGTGFVGREAELKQMHERLTQEKRLLLLQGLGGIGKTTLASEYAERFQIHYSHILWVYFAADLGTTFLAAMTQKQEVAKELPGTDFQACRQFLEALPGPQKLLIVDNCTDSQAVHELKKVYKDWTLLFTSRERLPGLPKLELQVLTPEAARKLFAEHCSRRTDSAALEALLQEIGYHTLLITLCARLCEKSTRPDFLEDLRQKLQEHRLSEARLKTSNPDYSPQEQTLQAHLATLHDLNPLPDFQKFLLQGFALWPAQPIPGEDLGTMTNLQSKKWTLFQRFIIAILPKRWLAQAGLSPFRSQDELTEALDDLVRQGWLRRSEEGEFTCHALTRHFIWDRLPPSLETAEPFIRGMAKCLYLSPTESPVLKARFFVLAEGLLAHFPQAETKALGTLCNNFGLRYQELGNLPASLRHNQRAVQIDEKILPANHPDLATSYNNLALIHKDLGELPQAKEYSLKALAIREAVLPANHPLLATSYNNLAMIHQDLGELPQAKAYKLKSLEIEEAVLPPQHPQLATSYNNLADICRVLGALPQAKEYHLKALAIFEAVLPANHPLLATSYNNLARVHQDLGDWAEAEALFQKAIGILEAIFPNGHPDLNLYRQNYRIFQEKRTAAQDPLAFLKLMEAELTQSGQATPEVLETLKALRHLGEADPEALRERLVAAEKKQ